MTERTLPHNFDAERSVLGAILVENKTYVDVSDMLAPDDFFRDAHKRIYSALRSLATRRVGADFVTLKEELQRVGDLDEVGGPAYIASLADGVPRATNIAHYAGIVLEKAQRRRLIYACNRALQDAYEGDVPIEELLEQTEQAVLAVSQSASSSDFVHTAAWVDETFQHLERLASDPRHVTGVSTGFRDLDRLTRGLQPGDLVIVGARPSMGKTALMQQIAINAAAEGQVGVFSVEMARLSLGIRSFAVVGHVNTMRLMTGRLKSEDYARVSAAMETLAGIPLAIDDSPILTPAQLRTKARRLHARYPLRALFVDYLQILEGPTHQTESRTLELAKMSRSLKQLAKELNIPVIVLSQLSRATDKREVKRPQLSDLRDSGAIEQDGDVVLLLHRPEYYQETPKAEDVGRAELIVAKQRNGPTGVVELRFTKEYTRFDDWSAQA